MFCLNIAKASSPLVCFRAVEDLRLLVQNALELMIAISFASVVGVFRQAYPIPKTPEDLRICDHCSLDSVENEMHLSVISL